MKTYTILKGFHLSNFFPWIKCAKKHLDVYNNVVFDRSAVYNIDEKSCVNKLFGFCYGLFGVHKNSIRYGWTYDKENDDISIFKYVYINGKLKKNVIFKTLIGDEHKYELYINDLENGEIAINFYVDNNLKDNFATKKPKSLFVFGLGPYFGGNTVAPHTIKIQFK